jgi:hypothetical protein
MSVDPSLVQASLSAVPLTPLFDKADLTRFSNMTINNSLGQDVKSATPQYIIFTEGDIDETYITERLFEDFSARELALISRADIVNGVPIIYSPIKNLGAIYQQFNPNNIIKLQDTSEEFFSKFAIKLNDKIPQYGTGTNGAYVYIDNSGNIVVDSINLQENEQIEINIAIGGTIYEANIDEVVS